MELRTLRYFLAVCEAGNMSRAARRLHVTQPTLSRQVADLERELGCELLVRHSRSIELTEEGRHLVNRATDIVALADLAKSECRIGSQTVAGEVRIACVETRGVETIVLCARRFREAYPQVRVRLHGGDATHAIERLERGLDDFAVLVGHPDIGRYEHVRLPEVDAWGVYLLADDPLARKEFVEPADLMENSLIVPEHAWDSDELSGWFGDRLVRVKIAASYTLGNHGLMLARAGIGPMLGLEGITAAGTDTGLEFRPLRPKVASHVDFAWRREQALTNAARLFANELGIYAKHVRLR